MRTLVVRPLLAGIALGLAGVATVIGGLLLTLSEQRAPVAAPASIFRNVEIVAVSSSEAAINFDFQLAPGSNYGSIRFAARPTQCTDIWNRLSFAPSAASSAQSGSMRGSNALRIVLAQPGTCRSDTVEIFVVRENDKQQVYQEQAALPLRLALAAAVAAVPATALPPAPSPTAVPASATAAAPTVAATSSPEPTATVPASATATAQPTKAATAAPTKTATAAPTKAATAAPTKAAAAAPTKTAQPTKKSGITATVRAATSASPAATATACVHPPNWVPYTIQASDFLIMLAERSNISLKELQRANCITTEKIYLGFTIYLPPSPTPTKAAAP